MAPSIVLTALSRHNSHAMAGDIGGTCARGLGVRVRGMRRVFEGGVVALDGLSLDVAPGEFLAILGPSGCGKSTLLRLMAGLDVPQGGTVAIDVGDDVSRAPDATSPRRAISTHRADVAYVFQDAHLLPWRDVMENVALPLELMHVDRAERCEAARRAIEQVGLLDAANRYPNQLSGGMRMRVSLARAMATRPRLLLLDEPFAALDEITRQRLDEQLRDLWYLARMTVIFVTHSTAEAAFLAERAIVLSSRPGRIITDHHIDLPAERHGSLRGTPRFAGETRALYEALDRGGP